MLDRIANAFIESEGMRIAMIVCSTLIVVKFGCCLNTLYLYTIL